jgi:hypothetical protein
MKMANGFIQPVRYSDTRKKFLELVARRWSPYYTGNIGVRRGENRDIDLIARLANGLAKSGKAYLATRRNTEYVREYLIWPRAKLTDDDLNEAIALTGAKSG